MTARSRLEFSAKTKDAALKRSGGFCECHRVSQLPTFNFGCGQKLGPGNIYFEHIVCDQLRPDNSLENCAALVRICWRLKTDTYDLPTIARAKRVHRKHHGIRSSSSRPLPCGRNSPWKKKIGGAVVPRRTRTSTA